MDEVDGHLKYYTKRFGIVIASYNIHEVDFEQGTIKAKRKLEETLDENDPNYEALKLIPEVMKELKDDTVHV